MLTTRLVRLIVKDHYEIQRGDIMKQLELIELELHEIDQLSADIKEENSTLARVRELHRDLKVCHDDLRMNEQFRRDIKRIHLVSHF